MGGVPSAGDPTGYSKTSLVSRDFFNLHLSFKSQIANGAGSLSVTDGS